MGKQSVATFIICLMLFISCKQETKSSNGSYNLAGGSCLLGRWSNASLPLKLRISTDLQGFGAGDIIGGLNPYEQMAKKWNDALYGSKSLIQLPFAPASNKSQKTNIRDYFNTAAPGEFGIYRSDTWFPDLSSKVLAVTQYYVSISDGEATLVHADIIMNFRDHGSNFVYSGAGLLQYDIPTVILHELGHLLGICHEDKSPSVMQPYYGVTNKYLMPFDQNRINAIYSRYTNALAVSEHSSAPKAKEATRDDPNLIRGLIEITDSGECNHYLDGNLVQSHTIDLK